MIEWLIGAAAAVIAIASIWFGGRKSIKTEIKAKGLEEYADTREKLDQVGRMSDADAARAWLHERGKQKGDL